MTYVLWKCTMDSPPASLREAMWAGFAIPWILRAYTLGGDRHEHHKKTQETVVALVSAFCFATTA